MHTTLTPHRSLYCHHRPHTPTHFKQEGFPSGEAGGHLYLEQLSHSMVPVVSLMVRSDTKAGYSVSHGTIMVFPRDLWAMYRKLGCWSDFNSRTYTHTHTHTHTHKHRTQDVDYTLYGSGWSKNQGFTFLGIFMFFNISKCIFWKYFYTTYYIWFQFLFKPIFSNF